mmetsp:Transcript_150594/g.419742  ORF Transcript_150594/g.419742 Transcript_150594/m.419742 type:complete len:242 (-) Transcript_150594:175-900(-)
MARHRRGTPCQREAQRSPVGGREGKEAVPRGRGQAAGGGRAAAPGAGALRAGRALRRQGGPRGGHPADGGGRARGGRRRGRAGGGHRGRAAEGGGAVLGREGAGCGDDVAGGAGHGKGGGGDLPQVRGRVERGCGARPAGARALPRRQAGQSGPGGQPGDAPLPAARGLPGRGLGRGDIRQDRRSRATPGAGLPAHPREEDRGRAPGWPWAGIGKALGLRRGRARVRRAGHACRSIDGQPP